MYKYINITNNNNATRIFFDELRINNIEGEENIIYFCVFIFTD